MEFELKFINPRQVNATVMECPDSAYCTVSLLFTAI